MDRKELITITNRPWKRSEIHYWTNPKDGNDNASVLFNGHLSRLRAGLIIMKGDQILLSEEADEPGAFSLPGGSVNRGEDIIEAAKREAEEEVRITVKNIEETGIDYCECHTEVKDWVKENVPEEEWWYNYYTCLCISEYDGEYKGHVDKNDVDLSMKNSAKFYDLKDVIDKPSFKYAWKLALYEYGYLTEKPEELVEKIVKVGNKWQVQSEKGRNLGTYDTKSEAEKRLKQVEYFKHLNESEGHVNKDLYVSDDVEEIALYISKLNLEEVRVFYYPYSKLYLVGNPEVYIHFDMVYDAIKDYYFSEEENFEISDDFAQEIYNDGVRLYVCNFEVKNHKSLKDYTYEYVVDLFGKVFYIYTRDINTKSCDLIWDYKLNPSNESLTTEKQFKMGTAGYIDPTGDFIYVDEYHGEEPYVSALGYPEFSNTHPEEDTCVRIYKEPNDKQFKKLEEVIDQYLDLEEYCKVEIWNSKGYDFYQVYSLREGACQDYTWNENVGNWTGYKLVRIIKNYFNHSLTEETRSSLISKAKSGEKYKDGKGNRWTAKSKCSLASTVADYNKIDMNTFWKEDKLHFGVKVKGETDDYVVGVMFSNILPKIQRKIADNKNKLEQRCIYDALIQAINSSDIYLECQCKDFKYRMRYWATKHGYDLGDKETRPTDITNPEDKKGPVCKHILAVLNNVEWLDKIASVINNYANYCKDNMQYNYAKYIFPKLYGMPYEKAVQMSIFDYDEEGNIKDTLSSDEELINLSNALGKVRGRFKKGSNKNPASS